MVLYVVIGGGVALAAVLGIYFVYDAGYREGFKKGVQHRKEAADATKKGNGRP